MAASDAVPQKGANWDEAQCKAALAQLEQLEEQLENLRLAIPRVVEPFTSHLSSGPVMYRAFKQGVVGSQNDIKSLRTRWHSHDIQSIFEHAKESLSNSSDLSAGAKVPRYGWTQAEITEKETARRRKDGAQNWEDFHVRLTNEDIAQVVEGFQKAHPNIKLGTKDDNQDLMIQFVTGGLKLRFHVVIEQEANDRHKLNAECLGATEPFLAITRCVSARPQENDLKYLLDMIAAYKTTKVSSCAKCSNLIDKSALIPTARRSKQVVGANETLETIWEAFHEGCLE